MVHGGRGAHEGLRFVLAGQNAEPHSKTVARSQFLDRARGLVADVVVVGRLAADDATQRDIAVIPSARFGRHRDRHRDFKRAGDRYDLAGRARLGDDALGATPQIGGDVLVEQGLDEQQMRGLRAHPFVLSAPETSSRRAT